MSAYITLMVNEFLGHDRFPNGVTCDLIAFLFKEGDRLKFMNWRPITILNTTYKIYAKTFQSHL